MLYGSNYIYLEFISDAKKQLGRYILENIPMNEIQSINLRLPKYVMLKFRSKDANIEETYNVLKIAMNPKDWNVRILNKT